VPAQYLPPGCRGRIKGGGDGGAGVPACRHCVLARFQVRRGGHLANQTTGLQAPFLKPGRNKPMKGQRMISSNFRLTEFLQRTEGQNLNELRISALTEYKSAEKRDEASSYVADLKGFDILLQGYDLRPAGMSEEGMVLVRPIIKSLVERGQLPATVLNVFKRELRNKPSN